MAIQAEKLGLYSYAGQVKGLVDLARTIRSNYPELDEFTGELADLFLDFNSKNRRKIAETYRLLQKLPTVVIGHMLISNFEKAIEKDAQASWYCKLCGDKLPENGKCGCNAS